MEVVTPHCIHVGNLVKGQLEATEDMYEDEIELRRCETRRRIIPLALDKFYLLISNR